MPASTQNTQPAAWPEGVVARYVTVVGAFVDITYNSPRGLLVATCSGCGMAESTDTHGLVTDTAGEEAARVEESMPESRDQAQAHAEKCRALPRPTT